MSEKSGDYLFEKVFFQAAHISLMDVALHEVRVDLINALTTHNFEPIQQALSKIDIAFNSVEKLKKGQA